MSIKNNKTKRKPSNHGTNKKSRLLRNIIILILAGTLFVGISGFFMLSNIVGKVIKENVIGNIKNIEPSEVLASDGTKFAEYGGVSRENINYNQVPQSVVDAFLSIEDSRFYSHKGFDLPRFISSALTNLKSGSLAQGGSTLTMQLVDNTTMKPEEEKLNAQGKDFNSIEKIERKVQEIYLSMKLENDWTKEEIMTKYLNEINFGGSARGIQKGAQYYFGKDVSALNLSESAFLAGVINAPNFYNPYNGGDYLTRAIHRRDKTLDMMLYHGFISKRECDLAKSTSLAFSLNNTSDNGNSEAYKAPLTQLQKEVIALTGKDPATTSMTIYTSLDLKAQDEANRLSSGETLTIPNNQYYQMGFTMVKNTTGEIVAVSGGRTDLEVNAADYRIRFMEPYQIGSTSKPLLDYVKAFDDLGWCTARVMNDTGTYKLDDKISISNSDGKAYGDVSLERAISQSLNTIALETMQAYIDEKGSASMIDYLKSIGLSDETADAFNIQYAVGGSELQFSPTQLAAAYASFANGGYYTTPHMVRKVVMKESGTTIETERDKTQIVSQEAAFMISDLLYKAVNGNYKGFNLMGSLGFGAYPVYGKTGTTNYDDNDTHGYAGMMKDEWMVNYTSEYTIATWTGFDKAITGADTAINNYLMANVNGYINKAMLDVITTDAATKISKPSGVSSYGGGYIKSEYLSNAGKINPKTEVNTETDNDALQKLIDSASAYLEADYTAETFLVFQHALASARRVASDSKASTTEINDAKATLQAAIDGLEKNVVVDFTKLKELIQTSQVYVDTSKYKADKVTALQTALSNAKIVFANKTSTQIEIDAAINAIDIAVKGCIDNPIGNTGDSETETPPVVIPPVVTPPAVTPPVTPPTDNSTTTTP